MLCIVAAFAVATGSASAAVSSGGYTFYTTADLCKLTVAPKTASQLVGTQQAFTATVTSTNPAPPQLQSVDASFGDTYDACVYGEIDELEGVTVAFKVTSGPNTGLTGEGALNASGVASFSFTSQLTGTDVVEASLELPDICYPIYNGEKADGPLPAACEGFFNEQPIAEALCQGPQAGAVVLECLTAKLTDTGQVTWSAPQVVAEADPSLAITKFKRCVSRVFKIAPSYSSGSIKSSTLFVDGKKKQTHSGAEAFQLSARSYKAGKHNFEVVTVFSNGKAASKFGSFTRCAAKVTVKRVTPQFTG
ncbi:MAG: hypothetical protein ACRDKI_00250 [Solirubrobacterales bacterium]